MLRIVRFNSSGTLDQSEYHSVHSRIVVTSFEWLPIRIGLLKRAGSCFLEKERKSELFKEHFSSYEA